MYRENENHRRWQAPSSTPWDKRALSDLGPAEKIVMDCHRDIYRYRHAPTSLEGEVDFFNGYIRDTCPRCASPHIEGNGSDAKGMRRWKCCFCGRSFSSVTGTIFHGHKIPVADWTEFLLEVISYGSMNEITRSDRRSATTVPYWMAKLFGVVEGVQDSTTLSGVVQIDEKYYPVAGKDAILNADGSKLRGFSRNHLCIAVGCDASGRSYFSHEGFGKPNNDRTWSAYAKHIEPGSRLIHDRERSHRILVKRLDLINEAYDSRTLAGLSDKDNPLHDVNRLCFLLETFLNSHSGFDRAGINGYLDLFSIIANEPQSKMEKAALMLDRAMRYPKTLQYRQFYKPKPSS